MLRLIKTALVTSSVAGAFALGAAGCSSGALPPVSRTSVTSADLSTQYAGSAAASLQRGAYEGALELAERSIAFRPDSAWAHYDRAVALQHLMRTNDAIAAYRLAQSLFPRTDVHGRSVAVYGVARALDEAGRCTEAAAAYEEFAALVETSEPRAASTARSYARECGQAHLRGADATASEMSSAVVDGDYSRALRKADLAAAVGGSVDLAPQSAWVDYNRGVALSEIGRTDDAVRAFEAAEARFASDEGALRSGKSSASRWGKSIAVYGRARALDNAGRCLEASKAYREYATLAPARAQAEVAIATSNKCRPLAGVPVMTTR